MVSGGVTVPGKHYRVITDKDDLFKKGEEVVALESEEVPYCISVSKYKGVPGILKYEDSEIGLLDAEDELGEMEDKLNEN